MCMYIYTDPGSPIDFAKHLPTQRPPSWNFLHFRASFRATSRRTGFLVYVELALPPTSGTYPWYLHQKRSETFLFGYLVFWSRLHSNCEHVTSRISRPWQITFNISSTILLSTADILKSRNCVLVYCPWNVLFASIGVVLIYQAKYWTLLDITINMSWQLNNRSVRKYNE